MLKISFVIFAALVAITTGEDNLPFVNCCKYKDLMDHDIGTKCSPNATSGDHKENFKARVCHLYCIAKEMNLVDGKSFIVNRFVELVEKKCADNSEEKEFYINKIKKCETAVTEWEKNHKGKDHDDSECPMNIFGIMMCLGHKVALECPAEMKVQSPECDKQREFFTKSKENFHKHHGHGNHE